MSQLGEPTPEHRCEVRSADPVDGRPVDGWLVRCSCGFSVGNFAEYERAFDEGHRHLDMAALRTVAACALSLRCTRGPHKYDHRQCPEAGYGVPCSLPCRVQAMSGKLPQRRVGEAWERYRRECIPNVAGAVQIEESRRAFYAGAAMLFDALTSGIPADGKEPTDEDMAVVESICAEFDEYLASLPR
jgi:hypothetical protein